MAAAGGRTLALFTSFSAMREAVERLEGRLPWKILMQGDGAKNALLRDFVEDEETSLFATMSFWQGVDAPGRTCSLVIIDRIPFPRPNEPVLQARRDRAGKAAFGTIDLPRAATLLAQGAGRLIRNGTDRGVVAVLDPRLATARSYRWELINALPPMTRTKDRDDVVRFLQELRDDGVDQ
jgi:ATP-dependent DNA helicase DinG